MHIFGISTIDGYTHQAYKTFDDAKAHFGKILGRVDFLEVEANKVWKVYKNGSFFSTIHKIPCSGSDINMLQTAIFKTAKEKGWWDNPRKFPEIAALCHSEISEALEEYREGRGMYYLAKDKQGVDKPEGIAVELVDCLIRVLDYLGSEDVDTQTILDEKIKYNETRAHRHGGKVC